MGLGGTFCLNTLGYAKLSSNGCSLIKECFLLTQVVREGVQEMFWRRQVFFAGLLFLLSLRVGQAERAAYFLEYAPGLTDDEEVVYRYRSAELRDWRLVKADAAELVRRLERGALLVVPDWRIRLWGDPIYPGAPELAPMWGLDNWGQAAVSCQPGAQGLVDWDMDAAELISSELGCGATVVVVDSGIDAGHPQLKHALGPKHWTTNGEVSTPSDDPYLPHGTHVSGTIAAAVDGEPPVGVAPCVTLISVDVFDGYYTSLSTILLGLDWLLQELPKGTLGEVVALNASWGGRGPIEAQKPLKDAFRALASHGVVLVVAAGNSGKLLDNEDFPASWDDIPELISVGAFDSTGDMACFSNYGSLVHVGAPGMAVLSTVPGGAESWSGTSMATPHVTAAAALIRRLRPEINPSEVRALLIATSKPPPKREQEPEPRHPDLLMGLHDLPRGPFRGGMISLGRALNNQHAN